MLLSLLATQFKPVFEELKLKVPTEIWTQSTARKPDEQEPGPFKTLCVNGRWLKTVFPSDAEVQIIPTRDSDLWVGKANYFRSGAITVEYGESFVVWKGKLYPSPMPWAFDGVHGGIAGRVTISDLRWFSADGSLYESCVFERGKWTAFKQQIPFWGADGRRFRMIYSAPPTIEEQRCTSQRYEKGNWNVIAPNAEILDVSSSGRPLLVSGSSSDGIASYATSSSSVLRLVGRMPRWIAPGPRFVFESPEGFAEGTVKRAQDFQSIAGWPKGVSVLGCYGWTNGGWLLKVSSKSPSKVARYAIFRPRM